MRLYTYSLRVDDGAAPNPYGGVCTLTVCKPFIRSTAKVGDWIVGLGSTHGLSGQNLSRSVVYAMRVSKKLTYAEYNEHCQTQLRAKLPDWSSDAPFEHQVGDCLYVPQPDGSFVQRRGVHGPNNVETDLRGHNALLAEDVFFYFGDKAVPLHEDLLSIAHPHQGHRVHLNEGIKEKVEAWMLGGFGRDLRPRILYGQPMHSHLVRPTDDPHACGICDERVVEDLDEEEASVC